MHSVRQSSCLELVTTRNIYLAGGQLTGIVVLRSEKPIYCDTLKVTVEGLEVPAVSGGRRQLPRQSVFFAREKLIAGIELPHSAYEQFSLLWNTFLARVERRRISAGEHIYPFAIPIPASLPPSYSGSAGSICYQISAQIKTFLARPVVVSKTVRIAALPRRKHSGPVNLMYPSPESSAKRAPIEVNVVLESPTLPLGDTFRGHLRVLNSDKINLGRVSAILEVRECLRGPVVQEIHRQTADEWVLENSAGHPELVEADFSLKVPSKAPPSLDGTFVSVSWIMKVRIDTEPPVELTSPVAVYTPLTE